MAKALRELLQFRPSQYVDEMVWFCYDELFDVLVSEITVTSMALDQQKYEDEASTRAAERNLTVRDGWMACIGRYNANELVFLHESAANERTSDRKYGCAPRKSSY